MMLAHSLLSKRKSTVIGNPKGCKKHDQIGSGGSGSSISRSASAFDLQTKQTASNAQKQNPSRSRHASMVIKHGTSAFADIPFDDATDESTGGEVTSAYIDSTAHLEEEFRGLDVGKLGFNLEDNEKIVQILCDFESGFSLMLDRIKQNMYSCKEVASFLKRRATIEEEYGRSMTKLSQSILASKSDDGKAGSYSEAWKHTLALHEQIGNIRLKFASNISAVADEISSLHKNTERSRKQLKEAGYKHWKSVHESENALEKAKKKYESSSEDWEHALLIRETVSEGMTTMMMPTTRQGGIAKSISTMQIWKQATITKNPDKVQKQEEDARNRAAIANENYKQQL
ncbi:hypothetical protein HK100_001463, partial [Physocladia obscura]